jgi:hypothetical protein
MNRMLARHGRIFDRQMNYRSRKRILPRQKPTDAIRRLHLLLPSDRLASYFTNRQQYQPSDP